MKLFKMFAPTNTFKKQGGDHSEGPIINCTTIEENRGHFSNKFGKN